MAVTVDPSYSAAVDEKSSFYEQAIGEMDAKLEVIRREDVKDAARKVKLGQLNEIAVAMDKEREIVARAEQFKFTDAILQSYADKDAD